MMLQITSVATKVNQGVADGNGIMKTILMNHLTGRSKTAKQIYLDMYIGALNEAGKLLGDAETLFKNKSYQRAYFLVFAALEEISKSQLSADVYTGFIEEKVFKNVYKSHKEKIKRVKWIQIDGNLYPCFQWDNIKIKDFDYKKKLQSLYVDVDFGNTSISTPSNKVTKDDAQSVIKAVKVGLSQIYYITEELGEQIGIKGFMK